MTIAIKFGYPRRGLTGYFNTFRLGGTWADKLPVGTQVDLVDSRSAKLLKRATVRGVFTGTLRDMAAVHANMAHNWRDHPKDQQAALLVASMCKRYPPGRCKEDSIVSVIYMEEMTDDGNHRDQDLAVP